jgi:hypothetical protein
MRFEDYLRRQFEFRVWGGIAGLCIGLAALSGIWGAIKNQPILSMVTIPLIIIGLICWGINSYLKNKFYYEREEPRKVHHMPGRYR